ncbi:MAG: ShlB/FhaC/HecB family hemolysin secretion/activation protein [Planctomycetota bacterium]
MGFSLSRQIRVVAAAVLAVACLGWPVGVAMAQADAPPIEFDTDRPAAPQVEVLQPSEDDDAGTEDDATQDRSIEVEPGDVVALPGDGPAFVITDVEVRYLEPADDLPSLAPLEGVEVRLTPTPTGDVAARTQGPVAEVALGAIGSPDTRLHASGVRSISEAIVRRFNDLGYAGVLVFPEPSQFDNQLNDLRPDDDKTMVLLVNLERVVSARTTARGDRFENAEDPTNLPQHARLLATSPVQAGPNPPAGTTDLVAIDRLNQHARRLSRFPGRRVDVAIAAGEVVDDEDIEGGPPGAATPEPRVGAELEYIVFEDKPWRVFFQVDNTGTEETAEWRQRFGATLLNVTDADDIFNIEFSTTSFDGSRSLVVAYERQLADSPWLRGGLLGSFSDYNASDLGFFGEDFTGQTYTLGGELILNVAELDAWFLDVVGGFEYQRIEVNNELAGAEAGVDYVLGRANLRAERRSATANFFGTVGLQWTWAPPLGNGDSGDLVILGRPEVSDEWVTLQWAATQSFYLEPILNPRAWADPSTPGSTLANEVVILFRGQYAFGNRLIPQFQQQAGGFYSVRGYPESATVGDTVIIATAEYRLHIPQLFAINPAPTPLIPGTDPFKLAPAQPYGRADWDLIFRAFFDAGVTLQTDRQFFEDNSELYGAGVGLEVQVLQNLSLRGDWAVALTDLVTSGENVSAGSSRLHFVASLVY